MNTEMNAVRAAIETLRARAMSEEYDLHALLADAFQKCGVAYAHEAKLAPRCRIDFLCGRVGVEVKKGRPERRALRAQIERYLATEQLDALIVVTPRAVMLPGELGGHPVENVSLNRLWGVALP